MSYFDPVNLPENFSRARASQLRDNFVRVQRAFEKLPPQDSLVTGAFLFGEEDAGSAAAAYALSTAAPVSELASGAQAAFVVRHTNTGAATMDVDSTGAKPLLQRDGRALEASQLRAGAVVGIVYDGVAWRTVSGVPYDAPAHVFEEAPPDLTLSLETAMGAVVLPQLVGAPAVAYAAAPLPQGLQFVPATRTLSGTPSRVEKVAVVYSAGALSLTFTVNVVTQSLVVDPTPDLQLVQGAYYSNLPLLEPTAGTAPFAYALADGVQLPPGLSFVASARSFRGLPTNVGTFRNIRYTVTDANDLSETLSMTIVVRGSAPLEVPESSPRTYQTGTMINAFRLPAATGGVPPYTYAVPNPPSGLAFAQDTRILSGTPDRVGTWNTEYIVTDSNGTQVTREIVVRVETAGARITAVVAANAAAATPADLDAGETFAIDANDLTLPAFSGTRKLVVAQPSALPDLLSIGIGLGNSLSAFTKLPATVAHDGVDYAVWISNEAQGDVLSEHAIEVY